MELIRFVESSSCMLLAGSFRALLLDPEDEGSASLRNVGELPNYKNCHHRRQCEKLKSNFIKLTQKFK
jgi:hypothetical protein